MSDSTITILLVEDNPLNARMVEELLRQAPAQSFEIRRADSLVNALNLLVRFPVDAILLDLMLPDSEGLETFLAMQRHAPRVPIVVLSGLDDEALALKAVANGAQDYLSKGNLSTDVLVRAVVYAVARMQNAPEAREPEARKGVVTAILGAKGGVGTTTLACHFAAELHRNSGKRTLLIDLDPSGAGAAFLLKAESRHTVADATANLHRLDAELWKGMVCETAHGVDLLRAPGAARADEPPSAERVRHVVRFAASLYDWILLDLGRLNASTADLLEEPRDLFLVTTVELPSLFESQRILKRLVEYGFAKERLHLLLNRYGGRAAVTSEDVERALGFAAYGTVADASDELFEAYGDGDFLRPQLGLRKQVTRIARQWLGMEAEPEASGVMRKWIGRIKGPALRA